MYNMPWQVCMIHKLSQKKRKKIIGVSKVLNLPIKLTHIDFRSFSVNSPLRTNNTGNYLIEIF